MWCTGLFAPRHVGSSRTRARTHVPCIGRRILNHCATREAQQWLFHLISIIHVVLKSRKGETQHCPRAVPLNINVCLKALHYFQYPLFPFLALLFTSCPPHRSFCLSHFLPNPSLALTFSIIRLLFRCLQFYFSFPLSPFFLSLPALFLQT